METIVLVILTVAIENQLPPNFVLAVATLKVPIESIDDIRTEWRDEESIKYHTYNLRDIAWKSYRNTWWQVALFYNRGNGMQTRKPSNSVIEYANGVIDRYAELEGGRINLLVGYTDEGGFY